MIIVVLLLCGEGEIKENLIEQTKSLSPKKKMS